MTEIIETLKNNPKPETDLEQILDKVSNEPNKTQSQIGQLSFIPKKILWKSNSNIGRTNWGHNKTIELKNNSLDFLTDKKEFLLKKFWKKWKKYIQLKI